MPVAILLFGPLADVVSVESILLVTGVLLALVGVLYARIGKIKDVGAEIESK